MPSIIKIARIALQTDTRCLITQSACHTKLLTPKAVIAVLARATLVSAVFSNSGQVEAQSLRFATGITDLPVCPSSMFAETRLQPSRTISTKLPPVVCVIKCAGGIITQKPGTER